MIRETNVSPTWRSPAINKNYKRIINFRSEIHWFFLIVICLQNMTTFLMGQNKEAPRRMWSVAGKRADLPCQPSPRKAGDHPILVLWYRHSADKPVYSYDARVGNFSSGERWVNRTIYGDRAYFSAVSKPPVLVLEPVIPQDDGLYICRLDYHDSPTTFLSINLTVIILPDVPEILWKGHQVVGPIGPLKEGFFYDLICITRNGRPLPSLLWWIDGHQAIDQIQELGYDGEIRSVLTIQASRDVNMKFLSCHAQIKLRGFPVAQPLTASVRLNITLPPIGISIKGGENAVGVDTTLSLLCLTWGSHPPAQISWWKAGKKVKSYSHHVKDSGNLTTSEIKVLIDRLDHGTTFMCQASNVMLKGLPLIASRRLNVTYKPSVSLQVKLSDQFIFKAHNSSDSQRTIMVKQGGNVQFECSSDANPVPSFIEWNKNGVIIDGGKEAWSLLLRKVKKENSGFYSCAATNSAGRGKSSSYNVMVEYPPECSSGWSQRTLGTEIGRSVTVLCRVEALPSNDISFAWSTMSSDGSEREIADHQVHVDGATSRISFTPNSLSEFTTLLCRAKNSVGLQERPCQVTLVPASSPDPPFNCSINTRSSALLSVSCREGFDGGFIQKFILVAIQNGKIKANISREFPEWSLQNLEYGKPVTIRVYAHNSRGRSKSIRMETFLHLPQVMADQDINKADGNSPNKGHKLPLIGILVGAGGLLGLVSLGILFLCCPTRKPSPSCLTKTGTTPSSVGELQRNPHSFVMPRCNFTPSEDGSSTLCHSRMSSSPKSFSCIKYATESPSKRLGTMHANNPMPYPLITAVNESDLSPENRSNVPQVVSSAADHKHCNCFERLEFQLPTLNQNVEPDKSSQKDPTEESIRLENLITSKGAIPKYSHIQNRESSYLCHKDDTNKVSSNLSDTFQIESLESNLLKHSPRSKSVQSMNDQFLKDDHNFTYQGSQCLTNNNINSLTYSNACWLDHGRPYYTYKHVKWYPHKSYRKYAKFTVSHQQSIAPYNYIPYKTSRIEHHKQKSLKRMQQSRILHILEDEPPKDSRLSVPDQSLRPTENECWSASCRSIICEGVDLQPVKNETEQEKSDSSSDKWCSDFKGRDKAPLDKPVFKRSQPNISRTFLFGKSRSQPLSTSCQKAQAVLSRSDENLNVGEPLLVSLDLLAPSKISRTPSEYTIYKPSSQVLRDQKELDRLKTEKMLKKSPNQLQEKDGPQNYEKRESQRLLDFKPVKKIDDQIHTNENRMPKTPKETHQRQKTNLLHCKDLGENKTNDSASALKAVLDHPLRKRKATQLDPLDPYIIQTMPKSHEHDILRGKVEEDRQIGQTRSGSLQRIPKGLKTVTVCKPEVTEIDQIRRKNQSKGEKLPLKSILRSNTSKKFIKHRPS